MATSKAINNAEVKGKKVATVKKSGSVTGEENLKPWSAKPVEGGGLKRKS